MRQLFQTQQAPGMQCRLYDQLCQQPDVPWRERRPATRRQRCTIWGRKNQLKGARRDHAPNERMIELGEPMNKAQEVDYPYPEEKLLGLLARRQVLPANSDRLPNLAHEIMALENLVSSYRMVRAAHILKA